MSNRVIGMCLALMAMGCSVERGTSDIPDLDAAADVDFAAPDMALSEMPLETDGAWILFTEDRRCIYPDLGDTVENIVWSFYLVSMEASSDNDAQLSIDARLCHQYLSPLPYGFITIVPERVTAALTTLNFSGFLVGRTPGSTFVTEVATHMWGYEDSDVEAALPTSADDERVFDQDGDGLPGVTLPIETPQGGAICDVRVVQRTALQVEGDIKNHRLIEGDFNVKPEEVVLSASTALCAGGDVLPSQANNRFELIKLPPSLSDCDAVYENLAQVQSLLRIPEATPDSDFCLFDAEIP